MLDNESESTERMEVVNIPDEQIPERNRRIVQEAIYGAPSGFDINVDALPLLRLRNGRVAIASLFGVPQSESTSSLGLSCDDGSTDT